VAGFLYYLSGVHSPVSSQGDGLAKLGLAYALGAGVSCVNVNGGPDAHAGMIVADTRRLGNKACGYYPGEQSWRKLPPGCLEPRQEETAVWVGFYTNDRPTAEDLLRPDALRGELLVLGDQRQPGWQIPILRSVVADPITDEVTLTPAVPIVAGVDEEGHWQVAQVAARYRAAWAIALAWCDTKAAVEFGQEDEYGNAMGSFDFEGLLDSAAAVLAVNYAVGKIEIDALGLFDTASPRKILDAATDWQAFSNWFKKKLSLAAMEPLATPSPAPVGSDSCDGSAASTLVMPQPSASG